MTSTLVRGKAIICKVDRQNRPVLVEDGAVLVRGGVIMAVGRFAELSRRHADATIVGSPEHVVTPGFVNAHHHVGMTPLQLGSPDLPLELWIVRRIAARAVDPYLDTMYSAFELIESGVTTVQHLHGRVPRPVDKATEVSARVIRAYEDIGMRVSYSFGVRDQNRVVYEADEKFLASLPADIAPSAAAYVGEQTFSLEESLEVFERLFERYRDAARVKIQLAPVNLHWCSDRAITRTAETARHYKVTMHMHLLETALQKEYAMRRTGGSPVRHLQSLGALGQDMTLGHGVWLTQDDIGLVAETGTAICHNCSSNFRLRSGVAPLNALRASGVRVALGLDEAGINDDRDMLQEMRLALRVHRVPGLEEDEVPSCAEIFRMATQDGATTTPFGDSIGAIEVGRAADLVLFDWRKIASPYLSPDVPVLDALMQRARREAVDAVMVAGEVVYEAGRFTRVDRATLTDELAALLGREPSETDERNREIGLRLLEEARHFYRGYVGEEGRKPFYAPSSRV
jgi:cytosine/adenosine deaminase-related metal-dependent hydrolase